MLDKFHANFTQSVPFDGYFPPAITTTILPGIISEYAKDGADSIQVPFELFRRVLWLTYPFFILSANNGLSPLGSGPIMSYM